jgi:hypothetical protein
MPDVYEETGAPLSPEHQALRDAYERDHPTPVGTVITGGHAAPSAPTVGPVVSSPPDDPQAAIDAILANSTHPANDPGHRDHARAHEGLLNLYRRLHGAEEEPIARPGEFTSADAVRDISLPEGVTWDAPAVGQLRAAVGSLEGVPPYFADLALLVAGRAISEMSMSDAQLDERLLRAWGPAYEARVDAVLALLQRVPASHRAAIEAQIDRYDLFGRPSFWIGLADLADRLGQDAAAAAFRREVEGGDA